MAQSASPNQQYAALVIPVSSLARQAGVRKEVTRSAIAAECFGNDVIAVPQGSPIDLKITLDAVSDGVLVTGSASVQLLGECVRCLEEFTDDFTVDLQELYVYPEKAGEYEESEQIVDEAIDLTSLIRDQVMLELPFAPVCDEDCLGLCSQCGANLNDNPDHAHEADVDARWAALKQWQS